LALAVPLSRFTSRVGGGSAFYVETRGSGGRVQAEARRRGLGQAPRVYVVADGGVWIWNLVTDRFAAATGVLDFYHASQHLWAVAHSLHPENAAAAQAWVGIERGLHRLPASIPRFTRLF
jgi:hypothetical protein